MEFMTVEEQIADAEYFLEAVKRRDTREELRPNLGAFLTMSRSIADHLLEDCIQTVNLHNVTFADAMLKGALSSKKQEQREEEYAT